MPCLTARAPSRSIHTGYYEVSVTYSRAGDRSQAVPYVVSSLDGTLHDTILVDQVSAACTPARLDSSLGVHWRDCIRHSGSARLGSARLSSVTLCNKSFHPRYLLLSTAFLDAAAQRRVQMALAGRVLFCGPLAPGATQSNNRCKRAQAAISHCDVLLLHRWGLRGEQAAIYSRMLFPACSLRTVLCPFLSSEHRR